MSPCGDSHPSIPPKSCLLPEADSNVFDFVFFKRLDSHNHMHRDSNPNFVSVDEPLEDQWPESEVLAMSKLPQVL